MRLWMGERRGIEKLEMREKVQDSLSAMRVLLGSLLKWIVLSLIVGSLVGVIASVFAHAVSWGTEFRIANPYLIYGMPLGGMAIVFLYKISGQEKNSGTNMVLTVIRSEEETMPGRVTPLILLSTVITHFFGGSSGREGAALQFGASVGSVLGRNLKLNESDKKIIILASMSAAFAALFGTPMAAAIFPMEVISVGVMYYGALVPCVFSAFVAEYVSLLMRVRTLQIPYLVEKVPDFYSINAGKAMILAAAFALAGVLFCKALHVCEYWMKRWFPNLYWRIVAGAVSVLLLQWILGTTDYLGLGEAVIQESFQIAQGPQRFLLKIIFTCLTLSAGFKGGEIVPSLFIGATLGSTLSAVLGLSPDLCAACGMVGVFCAVTNSPISSSLIALELFGFAGMPYYCVVIAVSYLLSGYQSLYKEQRIVYSKTENKYINRQTK